jgi:hypothetical protein
MKQNLGSHNFKDSLCGGGWLVTQGTDFYQEGIYVSHNVTDARVVAGNA